jgi:hypothetical protein
MDGVGMNNTSGLMEKRQIFCQIFDRLCKMMKYALLEDPKILKARLYLMSK